MKLRMSARLHLQAITLAVLLAMAGAARAQSGVACAGTERQHLGALTSEINAQEKHAFTLKPDQRSAALQAIQPLVAQRAKAVQSVDQQCGPACKSDQAEMTAIDNDIAVLQGRGKPATALTGDGSSANTQKIAGDRAQYLKWANQHTLDCAVPGDGLIGMATSRYYVVSIFYSPPGNGSTLGYASGSHAGTTASFSSEQDLSAVAEVETNVVKAEYDVGTGSGAKYTLDVGKDTEKTVSIIATQDDIDHTNDLFVIWLNPLFNFIQNASSTVVQVATISGQSPSIVTLSGYELQHPQSITDANTLVAISQLKPMDFKAILSNNPFFSASKVTTLNPARYTWVDSLQVEGPKKPGGLIQQIGGKETDQSVQTFETTNSFDNTFQIVFGGEIDFGVKVGAFAGLKVEAKTEHGSGTSNGGIEEMSYSLGSSTVKYSEPFDVYFDNAVKTYVFLHAPDAGQMAVAGTIHQITGAKSVTVLFKNGRRRTAAIQSDGSYQISGIPSEVVSVQYNGKVIKENRGNISQPIVEDF